MADEPKKSTPPPAKKVNIQMQKLDLHHYDYKILCSEHMLEQISRCSEIPKETKEKAFLELREKIQFAGSPVLRSINAIISEHQRYGKLKFTIRELISSRVLMNLLNLRDFLIHLN